MDNMKKIENFLISELSNMINEFRLNRLNEEIILDYFSRFLLDAGINPDIVIHVLEKENFGDIGKDIKVSFGY